MNKYEEHPVYWLNKWITDELRIQDLIPESVDYTTDLEGDENFTLPFMMPAQQTSESSTPYNEGHFKNLPFCVWTVERTGGHDQPWTKHGNATYVFYADDILNLLAISNLVHDLTNREDWSAIDINYYFRQDEDYPWDFKYVCFVSGTGPAPASDEGGRNAYMCIIEFDATYEGPGRDENYGAVTGLGRI